jgi:hypothetical protein
MDIWWNVSKNVTSKLEKLICNGLEVQISLNLGEALHHIRHPSLRRVLWADALCINQNCEEERSQQVSIMDSIYRNASRTLIWLGNDGNAERGLNRICQIVNSWDARKPANFSLFDPKTGKTHIRKPTSDLKNIPESRLMQALSEVFGYNWFHRRWVIQEVVVAKSADLLIGHSTISWAWVGLAAALLRTQYSHLVTNSINSSSKVIRHAMNAYFMFRLSLGCDMPPLEIDLLALLRLASYFENTDPLDSVYALRGLAEHISGIDMVQHLNVDYSLTEEQLLMNLTSLLMRSEKAPLDFLSDAGTIPNIPESRYRGWGGKAGASWIPRWTRKSRSLLDLWALDERFDASRGLPCQRLISRSPMHLAVQGILISTVMWRGDVLVFPIVENAVLSKLRPTSRSLLSLIQSGAFICTESTCSEESISSQVLEVFARVLTAGRDSQARRDRSKRANLPSFAAFLRLLLKKNTGTEYDALSAMAENIGPDTFLQIAETITMNRTLFVTMQGHLGLGPVEMQAGDEICVLGGASMPFILRKVVSGDPADNLYNLIGECYVDGIMNGETVNAMNEGRNHCGLFESRRLLEMLYEYPSVRDEGKEIMRKLLDEALQISEQVHARLDVSVVELQ